MHSISVGAAAGAGPAHRLAGRFVNGLDIVAVHLATRQAIGRRRERRRWDCRPEYENGTSVANWLFSQTNSTGSFQMPARFSAFVESAVVDGAVAEERRRRRDRS